VWMQDPPSRPRPPLRVRVSFEPNRLAAGHLAVAYDQLLPVVQRAVGRPTAAPPSPAQVEQAPPAKERA
jgi:hypothetical protein